MVLRLSYSIDVDSPGLWSLQTDQVPQQSALSATGPAEDGENASSLYIEGYVFHEHACAPTYPQIVNDYVWPR